MMPLPKVLMMELHKPAGLSQGHQFVIREATVPTDTAIGEYQGVIELETIHPTAKRIRIPMRGSVVEADTASGVESNTLRYAN